MDDLLGFLCFLTVFITPGHSLVCLKCVGQDSCLGPTMIEICQSSYSCGLAYSETTEAGTTSKDYIRSCVPTSKCNKVGSITYLSGRMKMGISCCNTDNCYPALPTWPTDNFQYSGLYCPSCRSQTQSWCKQQTNIQCISSEQTCIFESTITSGFGASAIGCATPNFCDVAEYSYESSDYNIYMAFFCFPATSSPGAIPTTGASLSCINCVSANSLACTGSSITCPLNNLCASAYMISGNGGTYSYFLARTCEPISKCNVRGTMTVSGSEVNFGTSCCSTNNCTPKISPVTTISAPSNGVQCKTCSSNIAICDSTNTMTCTGDENQCVNFTSVTLGTSSNSVIAYRGCGSKILCDAQYVSVDLPIGYMTIFFTCQSSTSCIICSSQNSLTCTGSLVAIPENYKCATAYRITTTSKDGAKVYEVIRYWVPVSKCDTSGTLTTSGAKFSMGISCCNGDGCTPSVQDTTSMSTVSNGVICKACSSGSSSSCETTNTMTCSGTESQCVTYTVTSVIGSSFMVSSVRGCGTQTLCDAQNFSSVSVSLAIEHRFTCGSNVNPTNGGVTVTNGGVTVTVPGSGSESLTWGVIFPFLCTAAVILILHQFNKDH